MAHPRARITVSALATASRCLVCFYETYVLKQRRPAGPHMIFGRMLHRAVEIYERSGRCLGIALGAIAGFRETFSPEQLDEARRIVRAYHGSEEHRPARARHVEHPVQFALGPLIVYGRVDRVDQIDGNLHLVEYKTGRAPNLSTLHLQCAAYALGLLQVHGLMPATWIVHLLSTGEKRELDPIISESELRKQLERAGQVIATRGWNSTGAPRCRGHQGVRLAPDVPSNQTSEPAQGVLFG